MKQQVKFMAVLFAALMVLSSTPAFAKKDGDPSGWGKGEKKGWHDEKMPPGLSKKDGEKAEREAKKAKNETEREAKKKQKEAEREAKKKQKEAEREAKKKQHEAEEAAEKAKEQAEKANS